MDPKISLKEAEQKIFLVAINDGLWDIFISCIFLQFSLAPLLSVRLGDLWSSAVFLPLYALVYLAIRLLRKHVVVPRVGRVKFGSARNARIGQFSLVMLVFNLLVLILGVIAAANVGSIPGRMTSIAFGMMLLLGFSLAAAFLNIGRLYGYGLLAGLAPPVGEWLFARGYTTHHGFPITFGFLAAVMIVTGVSLFVRLLRQYPPMEDLPAERA